LGAGSENFARILCAMDATQLQHYLHEHIPISAAMGVTVLSASKEGGVVVAAPYGPNRNHRATVFGGSLSTLAILSAWGWLRLYVDGSDPLPSLVIQREKMHFAAPASKDFEARCEVPEATALASFEKALSRHGRARLELASRVSSGEELVGRFEGSFVALHRPMPKF
jgi:thioesterase domain-containing protein